MGTPPYCCAWRACECEIATSEQCLAISAWIGWVSPLNGPWLVWTTGRPAHPPQAGDERAEEGVVVDDIHVRQRLVGGQHVRRLRNGDANRRDRRGIQEIGGNRALRLAHCEQPDLVTELLQAAGEVVDDDLGPAVGRRWNGNPGRGNQADPHLHCLLVSSRVTITLRQARQPAPGPGDGGRATGWTTPPGPERLAWRSADGAGTRRHGDSSGSAGRETSSGSRTLRTRGEVPETDNALITVRLEPLTESNLPRRKGTANVTRSCPAITARAGQSRLRAGDQALDQRISTFGATWRTFRCRTPDAPLDRINPTIAPAHQYGGKGHRLAIHEVFRAGNWRHSGEGGTAEPRVRTAVCAVPRLEKYPVTTKQR